MRRRTTLLAALAVASALVAVGCSDNGGSTEAFCRQVREVPDLRTIFDSYDPAEPEAALAQLRRTSERLRMLQEASPGEIRDDVETVADVTERLVTAVASIDPADPLAGLQRLDDFQADFTRVEPASERVTAFTAEKCGIDLVPPTDVTTTEVVTTTAVPAEG